MTTSPSDATNPADSGGRVVDIEIERELHQSYLLYAMRAPSPTGLCLTFEMASSLPNDAS